MLCRSIVIGLFVLCTLANSPSKAASIAQNPISVAQAQTQTAAPTPNRLQRIEKRTKETWSQMKRRWALQRERWAECRNEARTQRLAGRKTRQFLEDCMTR